ncbi:MAG: TonB-dependent receptor [Tannerella sp.]|nr:TonB-dependent receptor [Tannerella sp.]
MSIVKAAFFALLSGLVPFTSAAQAKTFPGVTVKGEIRDSVTNETLPYATIRISEEKTPATAVKALATDADGKFQAKLTREANYLLDVRYAGKAGKIIPVAATREQPVIDLGAVVLSDQNTLQEVVVSAYKPLVQVDLDKIIYSAEDDPDSRTENVLEMLKKVPLITVDAEDKIELKGSASFKIYMDGKPSSLISNNPSQVLKSMPASTVKSIEIITDPGAKYDAEGVSGIINIITNRQPLGGYTASLNAGLDHQGGYNGGAYLTSKYNKIGFTGNYNYYKFVSPDAFMASYRETYLPPAYLTTNATQEYKVTGQYGFGELSYEIDTFNLIGFSYNRYGGIVDATGDALARMDDAGRTVIYEYRQQFDYMQTYGGTDINLNYQRSFNKKDELFTASYRYGFSPGDSEMDNRIAYLSGGGGSYADSRRQQNTDAGMKEHTFQLDYTVPLAKIHTLEGGVKYIIRLNESNSGHRLYDSGRETWLADTLYDDALDVFRHRQDILSAYGGYGLKHEKTGFKTGLRMEQTSLKVEYPLDDVRNFNAGFFNLVPSATLSYRLKPTQTFRLGYNLRIRRPGISELNPYVNMRTLEFISSGNPNLETVKSHNFNLNYNYFHPKFNMNTTLSYGYTGNSIQRYTVLNHPDYPAGTSYDTYDNIGETQDARLDAYVNWNPVKLLRIYSNMSAAYRDIRTNNEMNFSNNGFMGRMHGGIQFNLPKDFSLSFNGGLSSPQIALQGEYSGYYYTNVSLNKSFLDKKLTLSVRGSGLTENRQKFISEDRTEQFYSRTENYQQSRRFAVSVSYRFGEMKQQIKKVQRGITNDDMEKNEGNSSGGAGGGVGVGK